MSEEYEKEGEENVLQSQDLDTSEKKGTQSRYDQELKKSHIERSPQEEELIKLETRIVEIEKRLQEIHLEGVKVGKNFIKRRQLESQKRDLKKELIDIAHDHKQIIIDQDERQYEKIKQEQEQKIRKLEQEVKKLRQSRKEEAAKNQKESEQKAAANEAQQTQEQTQIRRKARIIELESELNADNLRNSRRALIDYQLASLRLSYYPYRSYSRVYGSRYSYLSPYSYYI